MLISTPVVWQVNPCKVMGRSVLNPAGPFNSLKLFASKKYEDLIK
jgi:hypothetical protein